MKTPAAMDFPVPPPPFGGGNARSQNLTHSQALQLWLGRYISKRRSFLRGMGISAGLALVLLAVTLVCLTDVFIGLPVWTRWLLLTGIVALLGTFCGKALLAAQRIRRRTAMDEIENLLPEDGQLVRTALDEAGNPAATAPNGEGANPLKALLTAGLLGKARTITEGFRPERSLPWTRLRRRWMGAGAAALLCLALFVSWPDFHTAMRRLLNPSGGISFTQLEFVYYPDAFVAGRDAHIEVKMKGRPADAPLLAIRRGDSPDEPLRMFQRGTPTFVAPLGKPGTPLTLEATAGDGSTGVLTIPVVFPPTVSGINVSLTFPEYTGLKPATQTSPDIEAVEGTLADVSVTTDRPLKSAKVVFSDGGKLAVRQEGNLISFRAPLNRGRLTWKLDAEDSRGLKPDGASGKWVGLEDKAPKVEWISPKDDIEATPLAEVTLRAKAKDDFGLLQTGIMISAGGRERVLESEDYKDGVPVTAVAEALAALEKENVNIRDNVKVFAFARDRFPAPAGKERRGVSDLRNIDIRQFKVWRAMVEGGGAPPLNPKEQKALMKLETIVKEQRGVVNVVFHMKEENAADPGKSQVAAEKETRLSTGSQELKQAMKEASIPQDDLLLLDTAAQQMKAAAGTLAKLDIPESWVQADGALTSLLELRKEFMKIMSKNGKPCDCESKPDDFKLASLTELAKEAARLATEEREVAKAAPRTSGKPEDDEKVLTRQTTAQSDAGEFFDTLVSHPEVTDLARSRMGEAEKSMSSAGAELRERHVDAALPPLTAAADSLQHLAEHLLGLEAKRAAETLQLASEMAKKASSSCKSGGSSPSSTPGSSSGEGSGSGKSGEKKDSEAKPGEIAKEDKPAGDAKEGQEPKASDKPAADAGAPAGDKPAEKATADAARDAATINDWLKSLSESESLGRAGERLADLRKNLDTAGLAERLKALAKEGKGNGPAAAQGRQELASRMTKLSEVLNAEHDRMVEGMLEKLATAQAAAKAMSGKAGDKGGKGAKPGDGKGQGPGNNGQGSPSGAAGSAVGTASSHSGQNFGTFGDGKFSSAKPGTVQFGKDFADRLKDLNDPALTELSEAFASGIGDKGLNADVTAETLGKIESRLEGLIQEVIERQLLAGKSDRVPAAFEGLVENYFRRLSEDTGEEEQGETVREFPAPTEFDPPQIPQTFR